MFVDMIDRKTRSVNILLIEDNEGDVILTKRAFKQAKFLNNLSVVKSGEKALDFIKSANESDSPLPDLIILDLNLPGMDGQEVLSVIKNSEETKHIPVIVLSSSKAQQDVVKSYSLHANAYMLKPVSLEGFQDAIQKIGNFWFDLVVLQTS